MLSDRFSSRLKLSDVPSYKLCQEAHVNPWWLSRTIHRAIAVAPGDPRLLEIGRLLGLRADEVFEKEGDDACPTKHRRPSLGRSFALPARGPSKCWALVVFAGALWWRAGTLSARSLMLTWRSMSSTFLSLKKSQAPRAAAADSRVSRMPGADERRRVPVHRFDRPEGKGILRMAEGAGKNPGKQLPRRADSLYEETDRHDDQHTSHRHRLHHV
jgi:hypothetical protein